MTYKDLIPGEIYYCTYDSGLSYLNKIKDKDCNIIAYIDTKSNTYTGGGICNSLDCRPATIEEKQWLEECIKQKRFVPKNALKKESNYIVGVWYKTSMGSFVRYKETTRDGYFKASECIPYDNFKYYKEESFYSLSSNTHNFKIAKLEEFEKYLPDGHPDKTVKLASSDKLVLGMFNIGDVVVSLKDVSGSRMSGDIFKVGTKSNTYSLCYKTYYFSNEAKEWRFATLKEIEAFNKGINNIANIREDNMDDILKECFKKYPIGTKYKCANSDGDVVYEVNSQSFCIPNDGTIYGEEGKGCLYTNGKYAKIVSSNLKVGDIVVVTEQAYLGNAPVGLITKITQIDKSDIPYEVEWGETYSWCKNVRAATSEEKLNYNSDNLVDACLEIEPLKEDTKYSIDYKAGDWIFVNKITTSFCKLEIGKVYKVEAIRHDIVTTSLGYNGGEIFFRDIRRAYPHEIPKSDPIAYKVDISSLGVPTVKPKPLYSDIIEVKRLKTFSK